MPRFKHYNYDQDAMVVINYQEQLLPNTYEHTVHYLIEHRLDLSVFRSKYRNDDTGRSAYEPAILLKIILFAYSKSITSSCETNIIFKALSCDTVPHFTTLVKFVSSHAGVIEELFEQVRLVYHEQGLLGGICEARKRSRANGSYTAWCIILRSWRITGSWQRDAGDRRREMWLLGANNTGTDIVRGLKPGIEHWSRDESGGGNNSELGISTASLCARQTSRNK